jgi:hypothetical protein
MTKTSIIWTPNPNAKLESHLSSVSVSFNQSTILKAMLATNVNSSASQVTHYNLQSTTQYGTLLQRESSLSYENRKWEIEQIPELQFSVDTWAMDPGCSLSHSK